MSTGASTLAEVKAGGIRWQVLPQWRDLLFGSRGLRLEEWLRDGLACPIKHGPHRTVYRINLPGLSCYLKHYRLVGPRAWLRQLLRPAKARLEFERALAVAERCVPTVVPLALGEARGPGDSFLITRAIEDAESVSSFIEQTLLGVERVRHSRLCQRLAVSLGEFIAHLHDAGVEHHDLHPANLLVRIDAGDRPRIYLIDVDAAGLGQPLSRRISRKNLVMLNRWFILRVSRSDRLRFWFAYCRARARASSSAFASMAPNQLQSAREAARDLECQTLRSNLRFWQGRDRRCLAVNRYYRRCHSAVAAGHAVRDLDPRALQQMLADPDAPFHQPGVKFLKDSRSSTVMEFEVPVAGVLRPVIYKRFRVRHWADPWRALLRRSPAMRSWMLGQGLRERLLPTARPLAVFRRRRGFLTYEAYLLTEKIADAIDLHTCAARLASLNIKKRLVLLRPRIQQVAELVRRLHERQLSHRDLKAANILLTGGAAWLIDLVGVSRHRKLPYARRLQNLSRLHASFHDHRLLTRTDKLRFLRTYLQWGLLGRQGWKGWWRAIEAATQSKVKRNARNGRPLA